MRDEWADNQATAEGSVERRQVTLDRDARLLSKRAHSTDLGDIENISRLGWLAKAPTSQMAELQQGPGGQCSVTCVTPLELDHGESGGPGKGLGDSRQALKRSSGQEQFTTWYQGFHFTTVRPSTLCQTPLSEFNLLVTFSWQPQSTSLEPLSSGAGSLLPDRLSSCS